MKYYKVACKHRCFTLLEFVLVIAIIAVFSASAISYVAIRNESVMASDADSAADRLFIFLQSARVQAIRSGQIQKVFWESGTHCWKMVGNAEKELKMPDSVKVRIADPASEKETVDDLPAQNILSFYPSGDLEAKMVLLEDPDGRFFCFRFSEMTGEIYKEVRENIEDLQQLEKVMPLQEREL